MIWPFEYLAPKTLAEISTHIKNLPHAKLLAGGTDLMVEMRAGKERPDHLIDIKKVNELHEFSLGNHTDSYIGAAVTLNEMVEKIDALPKKEQVVFDGLREAAFSIATNQVRNRATAIGNICHASPAADMAPPLLVLDATVDILTNVVGEGSTLPLSQFFLHVKKSALKPGEWVRGLKIPPRSNDAKTIFLKRSRIHGHDLATVNVAALYDAEQKQLRLAVGACAVTPLLFNFDALCNQIPKGPEHLSKEVWQTVTGQLAPISDNRSSASYRREMVQLYIQQAIAYLIKSKP